jgi:hypothetical protein
MKRVVSSSIISVVILLLVAAAFLYYQYYKSESVSVYDAVPADVAWLVSIDPTSGNIRQLARTGFFNGHDSTDVLKEWYNSLIKFDSISVNNPNVKSLFNENSLVISGHVTGPGSFSVLYYIRLSSANPDAQATALVNGVLNPKEADQVRNYNGVDIREVTLDGNKIFSWTVSKGVFIGSYTSYLLEDAVRQQRSSKTPSPANSLTQFTRENPKNFTLAIRYSGFEKWITTQLNSSIGLKVDPLKRVGDWSVTRLEMHPNSIGFKGITLVSDSSQFLSLFKNQKPVQYKVIDILSSRTAAAIVWAVDDMKAWMPEFSRFLDKRTDNENRNKKSSELRNYFKNWLGQEIALIVTQPVSVGVDNHYFAAIRVNNEAQCKSDLQALEKYKLDPSATAPAEESYNGYTIRFVPEPDVLPIVFGPLFSKMNKCFYTIINGYLICSNQVSALRGYINDVKTNSLISQDPRFSALTSSIPQKGNLLFYCSIPQSEKIFRSVAAPTWVNWLVKYSERLKSWNGLIMNISNDGGIFNTNASLSYYDGGETGAKQVWSTKLDTTLLAGPFVTSDESNLMFVQDVNNQLYAISKDGSIVWKKGLESSLLGKINGVDYYKNGSRQYIFNTHSFIYVMDSTGANIGNFPIRLPAEATNGMALYQFEKGSSTNVYVACSNLRLYGYEITGKPLSGFTTVKLPDVVNLPVWISGAGNTKYITVCDKNGVCFFVDRKGDRKFTLKEKLFLLKNTIPQAASDTTQLFEWVNQNGILMSAKGEGEPLEIFKANVDSVSSLIPMDVNGDNERDFIVVSRDGIQATTNDGVVIYKFPNSERNTIVNAQTFTVGTKAYLSFYNDGENKVYLLKRDGTLCDGFPLQGINVPTIISASEFTFLIQTDSSTLSLYLLD